MKSLFGKLISRIIKVSRGESLDRYYLFKFRGYGLFLHHIKDSDPLGRWHTHPWDGISYHLRGYAESQLFADQDGCIHEQLSWRRWRNRVAATTPHRVITDKPLWTLFFHWPKSNQWKIFDRRLNVIATEPWKGADGHKDYTKP